MELFQYYSFYVAGNQIWLKFVPYTLLAHKVEFFEKNALRLQREDIFAQWRKQLDKKGWGKPKGHS
jgi:hypothetical protein